ncbi:MULTISPECIES: hypothetical protein [Bartonella]|uniref:hypothetical protein n=1 Tax=Bartonella TaxID=773 RepID=UPI001AA04BF1|nr:MULTISPECIES: hypothetical protein [Bartonella]
MNDGDDHLEELVQVAPIAERSNSANIAQLHIEVQYGQHDRIPQSLFCFALEIRKTFSQYLKRGENNLFL